MVTIGLIIFRELIEISILLSMIISSVKEYNKKFLAIVIGIILGISGSIICGLSLTEISNMYKGRGQEIFEICILSLSIILIFFTINWSQKDLKNAKDRLSNLSNQRRLFTIALMVALIILREGIEIFLFVYGAILSKQSTLPQIMAGIGCAVAYIIPLNIALYYGVTKFFYKSLFAITRWLLIFLAAGMGARIGNLLGSIELITVDITPIWDTSFFISNHSIIGRILGNMFGYNAQPNIIEVSFYIFVLVLMQMNKCTMLKKHLNIFAN